MADVKDEKGVKHNPIEIDLKTRIEEGRATKEDKLRYAKLRYKKLRSSAPIKTRLNPISAIRDSRIMKERRIRRIVAGRGNSHRDRLVDSHAENLADTIKAKAEAKKNLGESKN